MKELDDGPDGLNDKAWERALDRPSKSSVPNTDALCAKGEIRSTENDAMLGGAECAGCGRRFGGHGLRAFNSHCRAAKRRVTKVGAR